MPLDIQTGGFAERVRRALGVRGRLPLRLDEQVIPTVQVGQVNDTPYRLGDAYELMAWAHQNAVAGQFAFGSIQLPLATPGALVVWGSTLVNSTAADTYGLFLCNSADVIAAQTLPAINVLNVENTPRADAGALPFIQWGSPVGSSAAFGLGRRITTARMPLDGTLFIPLKVTLRPGWCLAWWRATVNVSLDVNFHATYYTSPDVSSS